jgi:hypothetical protein
MRMTLLCAPALALLGACAQVQSYGAVAIEQRRQMNDMQARATLAATCDISIGAFYRELSELERGYAGLVCGGVPPGLFPSPARPRAAFEG